MNNRETLIKSEERVDDLQVRDLKIIQNPKGFCFGIDAVLISNFCEVKENATVVDLGTGTGIIPLLIAGKSAASKIYGFEIQAEVADMAKRSVAYNGLEQRIEIVQANLCEAGSYLGAGIADVVVSNPPYVSKGGGLVNPTSQKAISRHEIHCTLEDVIQTSARLLKPGGSLFMVHRPQRLVDLMWYCRTYNLEPKLLRFVHPSLSAKPNIILVKCIKNSKPELKYLEPLIVYGDDGQYTEELKAIYATKSIDPKDKGRE